MVDCQHVHEAVAITAKQLRSREPQSWTCMDCRSQKSPWVCLMCGEIRCGRYVNGHAKQHAESNPDHPLCMGSDLSLFCYVHNDYAVNETPVIQDLRTEISKNSSPLEDVSGDGSSAPDGLPTPKKAKLHNGLHIAHTGPVRSVGLLNLGNTCFMNAILQSLCNVAQFREYFQSLEVAALEPAEAELKKPTHQYPTRNQCSTDSVSLVEEMQKVFQALWDKELTSYSPNSFLSAVWKLVPRFRGYHQQDAHEFLRYLLDQLHTELQRRSNTTGSNHHKWNGTVVSRLFGGRLQSDVTCLVCKKESRTYDPILDISLDIPEMKKGETSQSNCSLLDCLASFTSLEILDQTEWYHCDQCNCRQPSSKKLTVESIPRVLCLHLKRFRYTTFVRTKLNTQVDFPLCGLDIGPYTVTGGKTAYDLTSLVVHHGSGAGSGHYTMYAHSSVTGTWFHFNDGTVVDSDTQTVAAVKAYILFYVRRDL
ncbi:hypothetical protein EMCRGX_G022501 [Ephydatia muelleri]